VLHLEIPLLKNNSLHDRIPLLKHRLKENRKTGKKNKNSNFCFHFLPNNLWMHLMDKERNKSELASGFPTPQEGSTCNPVHPQSEGPHSQVAVMNFTHCLDFMESLPHVPPKLKVHFLFIPHESLNILQPSKREI
jgi:hypothetical protein